MATEHRIRQAILADLKLYAGAPLPVEDLIAISEQPAIRLCSDPDAVKREWNELRELGYIEPIPGYGGRYCRIAAKGRQQLLPDFPQDAFIHGPGAL